MKLVTNFRLMVSLLFGLTVFILLGSPAKAQNAPVLTKFGFPNMEAANFTGATRIALYPAMANDTFPLDTIFLGAITSRCDTTDTTGIQNIFVGNIASLISDPYDILGVWVYDQVTLATYQRFSLGNNAAIGDPIDPLRLPGNALGNFFGFTWRGQIPPAGSWLEFANAVGPGTITALGPCQQVTLDINGVDGQLIEDTQSPEVFSVSAPYPNPVTDMIKIDISLPREGKVKICIFDMMGRPVLDQLADFAKASSQKIELNLSNLNAGFYTATVTDETGERKVFRIKKY